MCALTASVIATATRRATSVPRHSAKSDGPDPDRLQPSAPASTAACLIAAKPGDERRPARLGDRVFERARDEREVGAVKAVDERAEVRPLPDGVGERHGRRRAARAPWPSRSRDQGARRPP